MFFFTGEVVTVLTCIALSKDRASDILGRLREYGYQITFRPNWIWREPPDPTTGFA